MGKKYFCWSFDDGLEQDKRIVEILRKYNMGATFHLNSGMFKDKTYEGRIGNLGMKEVPFEKFDVNKKHILPYVEHFRLSKEEAIELYKGFEISSHTVHHKLLAVGSLEERKKEIEDDVKMLRTIFNQEVVGFAYPYGIGAKKNRKLLDELGLLYSRQMKITKDFSFPTDPLTMGITGWHIKKNIFKIVEKFINTNSDNDMFFLMFAHGYEFDFNTKESNWNKFEKICQLVSSQKDIICCSIKDALVIHNN